MATLDSSPEPGRLRHGAASSVGPIPDDWQAAIAGAITDPAELCGALGLDPALAAGARRAEGGFPLLVPRTYLARIRPNDPCDPLLLQVLPREAELGQPPQFTRDPLAEANALRAPGLLWKYPGRILIVTTGCCAVHCRFCFRRHFPYRLVPQTLESWESVLAEVAADGLIEEVILSGGDPLMLGDEELAGLAKRLAQIDHVQRLRLHTRLPILIPQRVTGGLIRGLRATRLAPYMVVHVNHPAEIDGAVAAALTRLIEAGIPVLSQSVLLRGVNDQVEVLAELYRRLVGLRILPYYLHQLDRVAGAAHFEVPEAKGIELVEGLRARLPGYAVPRYVRETPDAPSKLPLA
jgi:L-lysine 2,3-aminomutase